MQSDVFQRKVATRDELLAHILNAAADTKKRENEFRRIIRDLRTRAAKYIEVDGGISEPLL
jgi:hypothetical protein